MMRRLLTVSPDHEPLWVRLCVHPVGDQWHSIIVADGVSPPGPGEVKGIGFYADTLAVARELALPYWSLAEPTN